MNQNLSPEIQEKISAITTDIQTFSGSIGDMAVTDDASQAQAIDLLGQIKVRYNRIEQLRKLFVQPLNDQVKVINNVFKMQLEPLERLETRIKAAIVPYVQKKEQEAQEAAKRAQEASKNGQELVPVEAPEKSVRTQSALMTARKVWKWEVTDEVLLRQTRPDFFVVDPVIVNKAVIRDGEREIPGIRIFQESNISIR